MMLRDVLPNPSCRNVVYGRLADLVLGCKHLGSSTGCNLAPNLNNLYSRQLCFGMRNPTRLAALGHSVRDVFDLRAKVQMRRIYTPRIIAGVHNHRAIGNRPIFQFPSVAMGSDHLVVNSNLPISRGGKAPQPFPTAIRCAFVNFLPKALRDRAVMLMASNESTSRGMNWLSAATLAEFNRGVVRGMIRHVASPSKAIGQAAGRFQRRCGISIPAFHYTANRCFSQDGGKR